MDSRLLSPRLVGVLVIPLSLVALATACSEWPRSANLPAEDVKDGTIDPMFFVNVTWDPQAPLSEADDNDSPVGVDVAQLAHANGVHFDASLEGLGWSPSSPNMATNPDCSNDERPLNPIPDQGAYAKDIDFFAFRVPTGEDGMLCVRILFDEDVAELGYDLPLYELDECMLPGDPLEDAEGRSIGVGLAGPLNAWSTAIEGGKTYAVGLGGFAPNTGVDLTVDYTLGISLHQAPSEGDGFCPALVVETP